MKLEKSDLENKVSEYEEYERLKEEELLSHQQQEDNLKKEFEKNTRRETDH